MFYDCDITLTIFLHAYDSVNELPSALGTTTSAPATATATVKSPLMSGGEEENTGGLKTDSSKDPVMVTKTEGNNSSVSNPGLKGLLLQVSLTFILVSAYFGMVLTNWASEESNNTLNTGNADTTKGYAAMWIQVSAQWIVLLLYGWSLFAPQVLTGREF